MIEAKFKIEDKWIYKDFKSQEDLDKYLLDNKDKIKEHQSRPKVEQNWARNIWNNLTGAKKNWKKVKGSPFASLTFALKVRRVIVGILIPYMLWMTYTMIRDYRANGFMGTLGKVIMGSIMGYVCYKVYQTIPQAKSQIEYYKKHPHLINYCPTDTKETVDDILKKIQQNKENLKEADNKDEQSIQKN